MASVVDEGIGNITDALMSSGNTKSVLFLSGDNGGQVHAGGSNYPLRGILKQLTVPRASCGSLAALAGLSCDLLTGCCRNALLVGYKGSLWEGGCRASAFIWSPLLPTRANFVWRGELRWKSHSSIGTTRMTEVQLVYLRVA
jgi:arylsulfatase A-like enzyme